MEADNKRAAIKQIQCGMESVTEAMLKFEAGTREGDAERQALEKLNASFSKGVG